MKPVVSVLNAWSCVVISAFAIVILSVLGSLYKSEHHGFVGSENDPEDGGAVAASIFTAVVIYALDNLLYIPLKKTWNSPFDLCPSYETNGYVKCIRGHS
ncbi:hypothetical protein HCH54_007455 [Aspergillus fumigatus]